MGVQCMNGPTAHGNPLAQDHPELALSLLRLDDQQMVVTKLLQRRFQPDKMDLKTNVVQELELRADIAPVEPILQRMRHLTRTLESGRKLPEWSRIEKGNKPLIESKVKHFAPDLTAQLAGCTLLTPALLERKCDSALRYYTEVLDKPKSYEKFFTLLQETQNKLRMGIRVSCIDYLQFPDWQKVETKSSRTQAKKEQDKRSETDPDAGMYRNKLSRSRPDHLLFCSM